MTMSLTYTVADILRMSFSKIGIDYDATETQNITDAHRQLNLMLCTIASNPDMAIARMIPLTGYTELTDIVDIPQEYVMMAVLRLAVLLSSDYDQKPDKALTDAANAAEANIQTFNIRRIGGKIPANGVLG